MIGSGIFVAPSITADYVESPALQLGLWLIGVERARRAVTTATVESVS